MPRNIEIGKLGENLACNFIKKLGYRVIKRNHKEKHDEIDVIATDKDLTLVFFEIKTLMMNSNSEFKPEDNFTIQKAKKVKRACQIFSAKHPELINEEMGWQLDLITVEIFGPKKVQLRHYRNV